MGGRGCRPGPERSPGRPHRVLPHRPRLRAARRLAEPVAAGALALALYGALGGGWERFPGYVIAPYSAAFALILALLAPRLGLPKALSASYLAIFAASELWEQGIHLRNVASGWISPLDRLLNLTPHLFALAMFWVLTEPRMGKLGWLLLAVGAGASSFLFFRESLPADMAARVAWLGFFAAVSHKKREVKARPARRFAWLRWPAPD